MPVCLKHEQAYEMGEYCPYCGVPEIPIHLPPEERCQHEWQQHTGGYTCKRCYKCAPYPENTIEHVLEDCSGWRKGAVYLRQALYERDGK